MHLYLSNGSPWNSNYCTEEGQVIYKVESNGPALGARRIKISRIVPPLIVDPHAETQDDALRDSFVHLAEVEYHWFRTSRIRYGDRDELTSKFFKDGGWSAYGRDRIFTGPDGRDYVWKLTTRVCKLFLNDGSETPVAIFHRRRLGVIGEARPASLEIFPPGEHMTDVIMVTFVYLEKLRKDRENGSHSGGGGG